MAAAVVTVVDAGEAAEASVVEVAVSVEVDDAVAVLVVVVVVVLDVHAGCFRVSGLGIPFGSRRFPHGHPLFVLLHRSSSVRSSCPDHGPPAACPC